jgi:hypothetical protein
VARRSRTGDLLKVILTSPLNLTIVIEELDGFMPRADLARGFVFQVPPFIIPPLPFPLTFGIIIVCLDLAGLFRNKDIHLC